MIKDMPPAGSHGHHLWIAEGISHLEKWANVSRPHFCVRLNCKMRPGRS